MEKKKETKKEETKKEKKDKKSQKTSPFIVPVYNLNGEEEKKVTLAKEIFSVKVNPRLLSQYVRVYLANQRQGTASTKTRGEVAGSTRKIYRQKGTGRARHGDIKAPIFVGGGVAGGPKPRDYSLKMTKKQKRKALFEALTTKLKENNIFILSSSSVKNIKKTKMAHKFLYSFFKTFSKKILFVFPKLQRNNFILAFRNIAGVNFSDAFSLNAYQVLSCEKIIFLDEALMILEKHFLKNLKK